MADTDQVSDAIVAEAEAAAETLAQVKAEIAKAVFGQERVVELSLAAVLAGGHALLIGAPGLAKTRLVEAMGTALGLTNQRIQFTPDLMPSDIIGSEVLDESPTGQRTFRFLKGPIFTQLLMADEINRASPRTQSALLQAMQEKTVTVAGQDRALGHPFHVLATQNPIEQEGTYSLPEAQLDRFLMYVEVSHPGADIEHQVLHLVLQNRCHARSKARATPRHGFSSPCARNLIQILPQLQKGLKAPLFSTFASPSPSRAVTESAGGRCAAG